MSIVVMLILIQQSNRDQDYKNVDNSLWKKFWIGFNCSAKKTNSAVMELTWSCDPRAFGSAEFSRVSLPNPGVDLFLGMMFCMSTKWGAELFLGIIPFGPRTGVAWNLPVEAAAWPPA